MKFLYHWHYQLTNGIIAAHILSVVQGKILSATSCSCYSFFLILSPVFLLPRDQFFGVVRNRWILSLLFVVVGHKLRWYSSRPNLWSIIYWIVLSRRLWGHIRAWSKFGASRPRELFAFVILAKATISITGSATNTLAISLFLYSAASTRIITERQSLSSSGRSCDGQRSICLVSSS